MFGFSEQNQDGSLDSADESVHTVPHACNSSGVEDELDPWGESAVNPSLGDDDSGIVASNTGREIALMFLHFLQLISLLIALRIQPIKSTCSIYKLHF